MLGIDLNEIASNSVVGVALAVCSWVGARIGGLISKVNRAEKDLNALWPRFRALEEKLNAGEPICEAGGKVGDGSLHSESDRPDSL